MRLCIQGSSLQAPKATLGSVPCACVLVSPLHIVRLRILSDQFFLCGCECLLVYTPSVNSSFFLKIAMARLAPARRRRVLTLPYGAA